MSYDDVDVDVVVVAVPAGIAVEVVREAYDRLSEGADVMLLEGGKLWTGSAVDLADKDVAALLDASVLLVAEFDKGVETIGVLPPRQGTRRRHGRGAR